MMTTKETILSDDVIVSPHKERKNLSKRKKDNVTEGIKIWVCFWRLNLHRFAIDYLGLQLYPFQMIILYLMNIMYSSCFVCARGLSKSYTCAIFLCCRAILFPGQLITVSCTTKEQSRNLIKGKIVDELMRQSPTLRKEIDEKKIRIGANETSITFKNGSVITAINASDNQRGKRSHILVIDEYRMIGGFEILNSVLKPFLNCIRVPKFKSRSDGKYKNYPPEENITCYLSSAWYANHWSYDLYTDHVKKMLEGKDFFTCNLPYQLSAYHGLLTRKRVEDIKTDENMSSVAFGMEFEALWHKESESSYFKSSDILPLRTLDYAWYPPTPEEWITEKNKNKKSYYYKRFSDKELRVLSCDIALMNSKNGVDNDNAIFTYFRCIPKNEKYIANVLHLESHEGWSANQLALRIKQLYYDGQCDYIVLDTGGNGLSVLDGLGEFTTDTERGITYPPLKCMNDDKYAERCGYSEAQKCIHCITSGARLNHDIATQLKSSFQNENIRLLKTQFEVDDLIEGYAKMTPEQQGAKLMPYIQTSLLQDELVLLEYEIKDSYIKVFETSGNRKDRYSSLSYGNYFIRLQEKRLKKKEKKKGLANLW